mmetsp:Transcript_40375/g.133646  ORF Transcript_40375/g.133646 Transcript_40375/m.133646 type:complete len:298 (+) Transcript_40375:820-1713(+)
MGPPGTARRGVGGLGSRRRRRVAPRAPARKLHRRVARRARRRRGGHGGADARLHLPLGQLLDRGHPLARAQHRHRRHLPRWRPVRADRAAEAAARAGGRAARAARRPFPSRLARLVRGQPAPALHGALPLPRLDLVWRAVRVPHLLAADVAGRGLGRALWPRQRAPRRQLGSVAGAGARHDVPHLPRPVEVQPAPALGGARRDGHAQAEAPRVVGPRLPRLPAGPHGRVRPRRRQRPRRGRERLYRRRRGGGATPVRRGCGKLGRPPGGGADPCKLFGASRARAAQRAEAAAAREGD